MGYVTAEPEEKKAYKDQLGGLHLSRDFAIAENFRADVNKACFDLVDEFPSLFSAIPVVVIERYVRAFVEHNPEMTRVMLGDREAT